MHWKLGIRMYVPTEVGEVCAAEIKNTLGKSARAYTYLRDVLVLHRFSLEAPHHGALLPCKPDR